MVSCKIYLSLMLVSHSLVISIILEKKWSGHHDAYRPDKIVELATSEGISPSFPILSTCITTKESFGIIPVSEKVSEELGFKRREEPAYEVNDKRNLLH